MLRPITDSDASGIIDLVVAAGLFEPDDSDFLSGMVSGHLAEGSEAAERFLVDAEPDGRIIGAVYYRPKEAADRAWDLTMIAVHPDEQRSGAGSRLMHHVESALRDAGERLLLVETSSTSGYVAARAFYRRNGYDEEARVRDYWTDGDDLVLFRKHLGTG